MISIQGILQVTSLSFSALFVNPSVHCHELDGDTAFPLEGGFHQNISLSDWILWIHAMNGSELFEHMVVLVGEGVFLVDLGKYIYLWH